MTQPQYNFVRRSYIRGIIGFEPTPSNWDLAFQQGNVPKKQINGIEHYDLISAVIALYDFYMRQEQNYRTMYETKYPNNKYKKLTEVYGEKAKQVKKALDRVI